MTNPFRRQDLTPPSGDGSEPSVPMPKFGISNPTPSTASLDAASRFPPADQISGVSQSLADIKEPPREDVAPARVGSVKNPFGINTDQARVGAAGRQPVSPHTSAQRTSKMMDVDSFKNLLMTGNAESTGSGTTVDSTRELTNMDDESSSSVDKPLTYQNRGRETINESLEFSSDYSDSDLEESTKNVTLQQKQKGRPPPPPKSKHGKAIQPRGPQVVSFDDFAPTVEVNEAPLELKKSNTPKPLPLPPMPVPQTKSSTPDSPKPIADNTSDNASGEIAPPAVAKKSAPPPPMARRSTVTKRPRGNTASSMQSLTEDQPPSRAPSIHDVNPKSPPPPPPTRRMGSSNNVILPALNLDQPAPQSRAVLETTTNRSRSSSQVSLASPPPAPPRRRSSKASIEITLKPNSIASATQSRRTSGEIPRSSMDSGRAQFLSQNDLPIAEETVEKEEASHAGKSTGPKPPLQTLPSGDDILADMEALQREIDSLRQKFGNP
jgi:hypothetical protein